MARTVDLSTRAGLAYLLHQDAKVVARDYRALRDLQPSLFQVAEPEGESAQGT